MAQLVVRQPSMQNIAGSNPPEAAYHQSEVGSQYLDCTKGPFGEGKYCPLEN